MERQPPRSFTRPIFSGFLARSLTFGVLRSLLQNSTERFATQARRQYEFNGDKFLTPRCVNIIHLKSDPEGDSFVFPSPDVSRDEVGETKLTVSLRI